MSIGTSLGLTLPVVSVTPGPEWATENNEIHQALIDAVEQGVLTSVGLTVDADIDMDGFQLTNVGALLLEDKDASFATPGSIYYRDGDFWATNPDGDEIQITDGPNVNVSGTGGIVGDYGGSNPAKVTYVDALSTYIFTQDPGLSAKIDTGEIKIRETGVALANAITLKSPGSLAGAYTLTLPTALPGSTQLLEVSAAGLVAPTTSATLTNLVVTSSLVGTGATANFSQLTLAASDIKHTSRTISWNGKASARFPSDSSVFYDSGPSTYFESSFTGSVYVPITIAAGETLTEAKVFIKDTSGNAVQMKVFEVSDTGSATQLGSTQNSAADATDQTLTCSFSRLTGSTFTYFILVTFAANNGRLYGGNFSHSRV